MDDEKNTPQGPVDPHGPGGIDAPAPPGGPQRTDAPAGSHTPGEPGQDPGVERPKPGGGSVETETKGDARDPQDDPDKAAQLENAETSLDEPSDGSGGE